MSLALVGASLATIGVPRARSGASTGQALLASIGGEELASTTDACRGALLREEASRARKAGHASLAIPVRLPPADTSRLATEPPRLPPEAIARRLAAVRSAIAAEGLRAIPLLELPPGEDCGSRRVRAFVTRWREAVRETAPDRGAKTTASSPPDSAQASRPGDAASPALAPHVLCRAHGSPSAIFDGGTGLGLPDAIVEETGLPKVDNGNFRRGWDGWRTRGRVALLPPAEPIG
ncbi:MAG: hypothetical protein ACKPBU_13205, partial [Alphaproteobacteria bacterium]